MSFRKLRQAARMTQADVAKALGVDQSSVAHWDCGRTRPRVYMLPKVAALYGCTVEELLAPDVKEQKEARHERT